MPRVVQTGKPVRHRQEAYENQASSNDFASHTLYHGHTQMAQRIAIKQICEKQRSARERNELRDNERHHLQADTARHKTGNNRKTGRQYKKEDKNQP